MKKFIFLLLILSAGIGGYYYYQQKVVPARKTVKKKQEFYKAEKGVIEVKIASSGRVIPNQNIEIKCKASGEIINLPFDISDTVQKGDLLVELDPVDEVRKVKLEEVSLSSNEANLIQAECNLKIAEKRIRNSALKADANLKAKKANLTEKSRKFDRIKQLKDKKLASQEDFDTAQLALTLAQSDLINAEAQVGEVAIDEQALELKRQDIVLSKSRIESQKVSLEQAKQRLAETKIFSPIAAAVTQRQVQKGQIISSGISNVGGGSTLMTLSDMSRIFIMAFVDESDIGKVSVGQKVKISVDAFPEKRFRGEVVQIALLGTNSSNVVTFEVKIEVKGPNKNLLKLEMTANVEIIVDRCEDAIILPEQCIETKKRHSFVKMRDKSGKINPMTIETGISFDEMIEVKSGIEEGAEILVLTDREIKSKWSGSGREPGGNRQTQRMMRRIGGR